MAKSFNISQFKSKLRQIENQQRQAINKYNQAVRQYNNNVRKAITDYNSFARNYNATLAANEKRYEAYELEQRALRIMDDEVAFAK